MTFQKIYFSMIFNDRGNPVQNLALWCNGYLTIVVSSRVANFTFWSQIFQFRIFWCTWLFLKIKNTSQKFVFSFYQSENHGLGKTLSEVHIVYKSLLTGVYDYAGCKEHCIGFTVALKGSNVFTNKKIHDSVLGEKMLLKIRSAFHARFLRVLIFIFVCLCMFYV